MLPFSLLKKATFKKLFTLFEYKAEISLNGILLFLFLLFHTFTCILKKTSRTTQREVFLERLQLLGKLQFLHFFENKHKVAQNFVEILELNHGVRIQL